MAKATEKIDACSSSLPHGRSLSDFGRLSAAEKRLLRDVANGAAWRPNGWDGSRPNKPTAANLLRANLIRFLVLGGDTKTPVHEEGIKIGGAWIEDTLSLHQAKAAVRLALTLCHFSSAPNFKASTIPELALNGSFVPGLSADRMIVQGGFFLRDGFTSAGEVRLLGVQIGGSLSFSGAKLRNVDADGGAAGNALNADRIIVRGGVFFKGDFEALGEVRLLGAQIGGSLNCEGAFRNVDAKGSALGDALSTDGIVVRGGVFLANGFESAGEVRLLNAQIEGDLSCGNATFRHADAEGRPLGDALCAGGMVVSGAFFLREIRSFVGGLDLATAKIGALVDEGFDWPSNLTLDGFRYDQIVGPTDARTRIAWLKKQVSAHLGIQFKPQPWEQLIAVLRVTGHKVEAAEVAIAKQNLLREAGQIGVRKTKNFPRSRMPRIRKGLDSFWNPLANRITKVWHGSYGLLSGYGHKPQRILFLTLGLVALSSLAYYEGRHDGLIGPTDPLVHMSARTVQCGTGGDPGTIPWTDPACPVPPEYSTFQPFFFALDVTLPFVDLHQEADWAPLVTNKEGETLWGGRLLRWLMWFNIIFGWVASLMFVAIVSRLVEKD